MPTITVSVSGAANLSATTPPLYPSQYVWPAGTSPNSTKTYTISDAHLQDVLVWSASLMLDSTPPSPTAPQILLSWLNTMLINPTIASVQRFFTPPPTPGVVPPPIIIS